MLCHTKLSCIVLLFFMAAVAGCKPPMANDGNSFASATAAQSAAVQNRIENLKNKGQPPPFLKDALFRVMKEQSAAVQKAIQNVVATAKTVATGTPREKADLLVNSLKQVVSVGISPAVAVLAPLLKSNQRALEPKVRAEVNSFLESQRQSIENSLRTNKFGLVAGAGEFIDSQDVAFLWESKNPADVAEIASTLATNAPGIALTNECSATENAKSRVCTAKMGENLMRYGLTIGVVSFVALIFGAGLLQVAALPAGAVAIFFIIAGAAVKASLL